MPRPSKPEQQPTPTSLQQDALAGANPKPSAKGRTTAKTPSTSSAARSGELGAGSSAHSIPQAGDGAAAGGADAGVVNARSTSQSKAPQSSTQHQHQADDEERIRARAYEYYEQRGRQDGNHHEDWVRAEAEVKGSKGNKGQKSA